MSALPAGWSVVILLGLLVMGGSVLVRLAPVPDGQLTKAQDNLIVIADWMVKASTSLLPARQF